MFGTLIMITQSILILVYLMKYEKLKFKYFKHDVEDLNYYKELIHSSFGLYMNANDTFNYASADSEILDEEHIAPLKELYKKYGYTTIVAYMSIKRGIDPIKPYCTSNFYEVREKIKLLNIYEDIE